MRVHYSFELIRISLYASLGHHKAYKFSRTNSKSTFQRVELHVVLTQELKGFLQMFGVTEALFGL